MDKYGPKREKGTEFLISERRLYQEATLISDPF